MSHFFRTSLIGGLSVLAVLGQSLGGGPWAYAHGGDDTSDAKPKGALVDPAIQALQEHLEQVLSKSVRHGVDAESADDEKAGRLLLDAAYDEVVDELKAQPASRNTAVLDLAKKLVHGFNPIALGKMLLDVGRRKGPMIAIAYGLNESVETIGLMLAAKYPAFLFVVPISVSHINDIVVIGLAVGIPQAIRLVKLWNRFGGVFSGPQAYYEQLLAQRRELPIDWSEVVDVSELRLTLGGEQSLDAGGVQDVQFAIVSEGLVESRLPRALKVLFTPRKLALRESVPTFSIAELEALAKSSGVDLHGLRAFRGEKQLYTEMLLRELSADRVSALALATELRIRNEKALVGGVSRPDNGWGRATMLDAAQLLDLASVDDLERLAGDVGETPDLIAQRAVWYLRDLADRLYERTKGVPRSDRGPDVKLGVARKSLRQLGKLIDTNASLALVANSPASREGRAEWETLYKELRRAAGLVETIRMASPQPKKDDKDDDAAIGVENRCEALLLGA